MNKRYLVDGQQSHALEGLAWMDMKFRQVNWVVICGLGLDSDSTG